ncbi:MAG: hypothetical protein C0596_13955 [Marinilabiliales bacterium]|nr:MAG: hypothetical protein C0596_13955 [Marinilabiliales bacterium]
MKVKNTCLILVLSIFSSCFIYSQEDFTISSSVEFDIKPDYRKSNTTEDTDVIVFTISVKNNCDELIPDLGATKRSDHLNFLVNDSIQNPLCLYNGTEQINDHMLRKGQEDTYEWWIYADDTESYGNKFTVQWQYMDRFSEKYYISLKDKQVLLIDN